MKEKLIALLTPYVAPELVAVLAQDLMELFLYEDYPASPEGPVEVITE